MLDPYKIREDFPSIVGDYIFMNNADSTGIPVPVLEKILAYYNEVKSRPGSENTPSRRALELYEESRETVLKHLGAGEGNIVFSSSNIQSLMTILQSIELKNNDVFLVSSNAQGRSMSIIKECVERNKGRIETVDVESEGVEDRFKEAAAKKGVKAAFLSHVSSVTGTILPVDRIIPVLKDRNITTILDATYSAQRIKLNMLRMGVDYAYLKSGNMFSIEGLSVIYVSENRRDRFEKTKEYLLIKQCEGENYVGVVSLAAAIKYLDGMGFEEVLNHERSLVEELTGVAAGEEITFYQAASKELKSGIFSLTLDQVPSNLLQAILEDQFHILAECGSFDSPYILQKTGGRDVLRLSPTVFNTIEEVRRVGEKLHEIREAYVEKVVEEKQVAEEEKPQPSE